MPTVSIVGKRGNEVKPLVESVGFSLVSRDPELVICFGGDGTFMHAEATFPGIPKVLLRDSAICKKCSNFTNEEVLQHIAAGQYRIEELLKLEVEAQGRILRAVNDVILHNSDPRHAIRYALRVGNRSLGERIIGDGIVVATPFGSTGYYRSITDSSFEVGIGLAFNNSTEQSDHLVLPSDSTIVADIVRGPAIVYADNQEESITLGEGMSATVRCAAERAKIIVVE